MSSWLGSVGTVWRWTCDREVVDSNPGQLAINWSLLGWVTVCGRVNHLGGLYNQHQGHLSLLSLRGK